MLRRLKALGANQSELLDIYIKQVRSVLEFAANKADIERVKKCALSIILGKQYQSYDSAIQVVNIEKLTVRREALCLKFAQKCLRNPGPKGD